MIKARFTIGTQTICLARPMSRKQFSLLSRWSRAERFEMTMQALQISMFALLYKPALYNGALSRSKNIDLYWNMAATVSISTVSVRTVTFCSILSKPELLSLFINFIHIMTNIESHKFKAWSRSETRAQFPRRSRATPCRITKVLCSSLLMADLLFRGCSLAR